MKILGEKMDAQAKLGAALIMNAAIAEKLPQIHLRYHFRCLDKNGDIRWEETIDNLVPTAGKNDLLDKYFAGSAYTAAWKLGLKGAGSPAAGDTLASHAGWAEVTPYAGNRPAITWNAASAGAKTAVTVSISINASTTVAGGFVTDQATGTAGILFSASDFTGGSRAVQSGDTLQVSISMSV